MGKVVTIALGVALGGTLLKIGQKSETFKQATNRVANWVDSVFLKED